MRKFKYHNHRKIMLNYLLVVIILTTFFLLCGYDKKISPKIIDVASSKLDEITTLYIKKNIIPQKIDLFELIQVTKNANDEILMIDTNYEYAYKLMKEIVNNIQTSIHLLEKGNIGGYENSREIKTNNQNLYLELPLGLSKTGTLFSSLGPKIPVKMSFYEHVLGTIETNVEAYGINNSLIKVTMIIDLEQKLILPYQEKKINKQYKLELGSKVILGTIPDLYGGNIFQKSSIIE